MTSTFSTSAKSATVTTSPTLCSSPFSTRTSRREADRLDASLSEVTSHGLVHVLGLDVAETDLDGVIAVGHLSFNLRDSAGAG